MSPRAGSSGAGPAAGATAQIRADVAKFFVDLRKTIGASPPQIATQLKTTIRVVAALERADVDALPPWTECQRIVIAYTAWAGIDGRPVLTALNILAQEAEQRRRMAAQAAAVRPAVTASAERLAQMRLVISESARRLPREALNQARARPVQTFYALSVPLGLVLLLFNANVLSAAYSHVPRPVKNAVRALNDMAAVAFAPRREGLRWIEVSDPRSRRADKQSPQER